MVQVGLGACCVWYCGLKIPYLVARSATYELWTIEGWRYSAPRLETLEPGQLRAAARCSSRWNGRAGSGVGMMVW